MLTIILCLSACDTTVEGSARSVSTPVATDEEIIPSTPEITFTPFIYPELRTATDPCGIDLPTRLILHERGRVADEDDRPLNMREGPDVDFAQIRQLRINSVFLVLDGPECTEDYIWYFVRHNGLEGWIAEGESGIYYVEPYFPG